ncbi:MAG: hypothetical protein ABI230_06140 [Aestuariivirga sp.]
MRSMIRAAAFFCFVSMFNVSAFASGDFGCSAAMKVFIAGFSSCDTLGFLAPSNDTRINLIYLMADAHKQKLKIVDHTAQPDSGSIDSSMFDDGWSNFVASFTPPQPTSDAADSQDTLGEGSVCVSDVKGKEQFLAAVAADGSISDEAKTKLKSVREAIECQSPATNTANLDQQVDEPAAKEFLAYLAAVNRFYLTDHFDASGFAALANANQPWVKEAARYMQARVLLLAAQANAFDEYGTLQKNNISQVVVNNALDALNAYLKDYPTGTYAASATGLLRRAYWLGGDTSKQVEAYAKLVSSNEVSEASFALADELDFKLPIDAYTDNSSSAMLLAVQDLRLLREQKDNDGKPLAGMKNDVLEAQRSRFASDPELFDYLLAARAWFVDKDAKAVLAHLPEKPIAAEMSYLEFSRQLLRAAALDATNDASTRNVYVSMFPASQSAYQHVTLELSLAMFDERHKNVGADFEKDTLIQDPTIRKQLLDYVAGPIILRQQATSTDASQDERDTALFRLLSHDLVQGHFKGFLEDIKLLPAKPVAAATADASPVDLFNAFRWEGRKEGYICPDIIGVANILNTNAHDVRGRMCLADFFRLRGVGNVVVSDKDELGGTGTLFSGMPLTQQDIFIDVMKDKSATRDDRAYALFRAVHCYEPVGNNTCDGTDVPKPVRKAWHDELKGSYGDTVWAKALKYYW